MLASESGVTVRLRNHHIWLGALEHTQRIYSASSHPEDAPDEDSDFDHTGAVFWPCSYVMALVLERATASIEGPALELGAVAFARLPCLSIYRSFAWELRGLCVV